MFSPGCLSASFKQCLWPSFSRIWEDKDTFPPFFFPHPVYQVYSLCCHFTLSAFWCTPQNTLISKLIGSSSCISFSLRPTLDPIRWGQCLYLYEQEAPPILLHQQNVLCSEVIPALPISRGHWELPMPKPSIFHLTWRHPIWPSAVSLLVL